MNSPRLSSRSKFPRSIALGSALLGFGALSLSTSLAAVSLPAIFSDHAVLQKAAVVPIWGKGEPGEKVTITLGSAKATATTGANGRWETTLDLSRSAQGPFSLVAQGTNTLTINDVVVGEVWLASGQSNMEWVLKATTGGAAEVAGSANPLLRQFSVLKAEAAIPLKNADGKWTVASPETSGAFTAVGYHFGKVLQRDLKVPVGIVHSSWGGTAVETWTSKEALDSIPELKAGAEKSEQNLKSYSRRLREYVVATGDWQETSKRQDRPSDTIPTSGWTAVSIPGKISDPGAAWVRTKVTVGADQADKNLWINLGDIRGLEQAYWDGARIGDTTLEQAVKSRDGRRQIIPAAQAKAGEHVLVLRIFNAVEDVALNRAVTAGGKALSSGWEQKPDFSLPALSADEKAALPKSPGLEPWAWDTASHLYNAMLNPLIPYGIKGVIWYQGESNVGRAQQYRKAFPLLINDWRGRWKQPELPFIFCQLANMANKSDKPGESNWAELRESQNLTLSLPATGQAVLIDIGESDDVHPRNKQTVGERLGAIALAQTYGKSVPFTGPVFESAKVSGSQIRVTFKKAGGDLVAKPLPATYDVNSSQGKTAPTFRNSPNSQVEGFAICGADRQWVWADAKIEGNAVVVSSKQVPAPVAVRYGWANNPTCNLYNGAGLPASPFRTDDFPLISQSTTY